MFIAVNRISAPKEAIERMTEAFRRNAASLKDFEGFIAFELWRGDDGLEAVSKWESREAFDAWRSSDNFLASHAGARGGQGGGASATYYDGEVMAER
ncbi:MAG TPA: antibiotic biosynthesis monooxygenase family protein [Ktedonobacterales bacterium]|nr:antibiotic biosynthesis monooxygenase family protein [Ktedonobacterales bacterium]